MNVSEKTPDEQPAPEQHTACLSLGSNIEPGMYLPQAVALLRQAATVTGISTCWESAAFESSGPNFINLAVNLQTPLDAAHLKTEVIASIERALGRVRLPDKNAPRTIDIDIIVFDGQVVEPALWQRAYLALTVGELCPGLVEPITGRALSAVAATLIASQPAQQRPGFLSFTG